MLTESKITKTKKTQASRDISEIIPKEWKMCTESKTVGLTKENEK